MLLPGDVVDRYGDLSGRFVAPVGTPLEQRSLAPWTEESAYHQYKVLKPLQVDSGKTAPWFDRPGGGIQHDLGRSVQDLVDSGHLQPLN